MRNGRKHHNYANIIFPLLVVLALLIGSGFLTYGELWDKITNSVDIAEEGETADRPADIPKSSGSFHVLDVGQGLCVVLESDGEFAVYDGGGQNYAPQVLRFLKDLGVQKLKYVIASHYDYDHISGLIQILKEIPVSTVMGADYKADTPVSKYFEDTVKREGLELMHPSVGSVFELGSSKLRVLGPLGTDYENENDYSLVVRAETSAAALLLTGDMSLESEGELCAGSDISADILVAAHHGSSTSSSQEFLYEVDPDTVIISCSEDNTYHHPARSVMRRLDSMGCRLYRTDFQGTVSCSFEDTSLTWDSDPCLDYSGR